MSEESIGTAQECVSIVLREYLSANPGLVRSLTEVLKDEGIITRQQKKAIYDILKDGDVNQALEKTIDLVSASDDGLQALVPALQSEELSDAFDQRIAKVIEVLLKPGTDGSLSWIVLSWSEILSHEAGVREIINEIWPGGLQFPEDDPLQWPFHLLHFCITDGKQQDVAEFARRARDAIESKEFVRTDEGAVSPEPISDLKSVEFPAEEQMYLSEEEPLTPPPESFVILSSDGEQAQSDGQLTQDGAGAFQEHVLTAIQSSQEPIVDAMQVTEENAAVGSIPNQPDQIETSNQGDRMQADVAGDEGQPASRTSEGMETDSIDGDGQLPPDQESFEGQSQKVIDTSYVSDTSSDLNREAESTVQRGARGGEVPHGGDEQLLHELKPQLVPHGGDEELVHGLKPQLGDEVTPPFAGIGDGELPRGKEQTTGTQQQPGLQGGESSPPSSAVVGSLHEEGSEKNPNNIPVDQTNVNGTPSLQEDLSAQPSSMPHSLQLGSLPEDCGQSNIGTGNDIGGDDDASLVFVYQQKEIASHLNELAPLVSLVWRRDETLVEEETWPQKLIEKMEMEDPALIEGFAKLTKLILEKAGSLAATTPTKANLWLANIKKYSAKDEEDVLPVLTKLAWPDIDTAVDGWQGKILAKCRKHKNRAVKFVQVAKMILPNPAKAGTKAIAKSLDESAGSELQGDGEGRSQTVPKSHTGTESFGGDPLGVDQGQDPSAEGSEDEVYHSGQEELFDWEQVQRTNPEEGVEGELSDDELEIGTVAIAVPGNFENSSLQIMTQSLQGSPTRGFHQYGSGMDRSLPAAAVHFPGGQSQPVPGIEFRVIVAPRLDPRDIVEVAANSVPHNMNWHRDGHYYYFMPNPPAELLYKYFVKRPDRVKETLPEQRAFRKVITGTGGHTTLYDVATFSKSQMIGRNPWKSCLNEYIGEHLPRLPGFLNAKIEIYGWTNQLKLGWRIGSKMYYCDEKILEKRLTEWLKMVMEQTDQSGDAITRVVCTLAVAHALKSMAHRVETNGLLFKLFRGLQIEDVGVEMRKRLISRIYEDYGSRNSS